MGGGGVIPRILPHSRRSVVPDEERSVYRYSHEVAVVVATYAASFARLAVADSLHCNVRDWNRDMFPTAPGAYGTSVIDPMKLHLIQLHLARRLS